MLLLSSLKASLTLLVVLSSLIIGMLLAKWTKDELTSGRKYFRLILLLSLFLIIISLDLSVFKIIEWKTGISSALAFLYLLIITMMSLRANNK